MADFSQIEADVAQLDVNNRFTLFFPEKRPFFLEGADYFARTANSNRPTKKTASLQSAD